MGQLSVGVADELYDYNRPNGFGGGRAVSPHMITFLCGFGGSIAVEIVLLHQVMQTDSALPARYKNLEFWIVRTLLAIVSGGLALAYEIDKPLLAANIGAATPLIIKAFSEGIRPAIGNLPNEESRPTAREPS
jgi:hypothetical protein